MYKEILGIFAAKPKKNTSLYLPLAYNIKNIASLKIMKGNPTNKIDKISLESKKAVPKIDNISLE